MGFVLLFTFGCGLLLGGVGKLGYFLSLFLWCMVLLFYQNIWAFFWEIFAYYIRYLITFEYEISVGKKHSVKGYF